MGTVFIDNFLHFALIIIVAILGYVFKHIFVKPLVDIRSDLNKHVEDCNETPRELIVEKINNLCSKVESNHEYVKEMKQEFKDELNHLRLKLFKG